MTATAEPEQGVHVIATAGHVDHGKSSLITRLTGMDPDRLEEEKRRGLTIDLGFAWFTLPSGREIGFVDVPGHERFLHTMLAGVGPAPLVLFVVAADEGWQRQSEEHLQIVDLFEMSGAVVALTKVDLVDDDRLAEAERHVRERLSGTTLADAHVVPVSSKTGDGIDDLARALDGVATAADAAIDNWGGPPDAVRLDVDRVFSITGAGTVVTGTLARGVLHEGDDVALLPSGVRGRIRGLQSHKRTVLGIGSVSRVAVNLGGVEREQVARGDVLTRPGTWHVTAVAEVQLAPVRDLAHAPTDRGAFKFYAGSAERDCRIRLYDDGFARIWLDDPLPLAVGDLFVLRDSGRRETVGGGRVLDVAPPVRPGTNPPERLAKRAAAAPIQLIDLLVEEREAISVAEAEELATAQVPFDHPARVGSDWLAATGVSGAAATALTNDLSRFHDQHPAQTGQELSAARAVIAGTLRSRRIEADDGLIDAFIGWMSDTGIIVREGSTVRLTEHATTTDPDVERLIQRIADAEPQPPTVRELATDGFSRDTLEAAITAGTLVRISPDLVMTTTFVEQAKDALALLQSDITVSAFREQLATSRKFALPMLEYFDRKGVTRRDGDVRVLRGS